MDDNQTCCQQHDDVIKWKHFPRYWPFVRGIHRSQVHSPHRGQWRRTFMFSLICAWAKSWVNSRDGGDLRRHCAHYDVTETRFVQTVTACLCCDHMSVFKVPCFGLTVNIPLIVSNVRKKTYVYYIFTNTTGPFDDPDSEGPWIDIDQISIPRESVRSMSDRCWSDGLCHLGTAYGADLSSVQWCCITMTS